MSSIIEAMAAPKSADFELVILDSSGDTRLSWDPTKHDQVAAAKKRFNELKSKGYSAFKVTASGSQGEMLKDFDPMEERTILVPGMVGG